MASTTLIPRGHWRARLPLNGQRFCLHHHRTLQGLRLLCRVLPRSRAFTFLGVQFQGISPTAPRSSGKYSSCSLRSCFRTPQSTELARSNLLRNAAAGACGRRRTPCCSPAPRIACAGTEPDDWRESWSGGRLAEGGNPRLAVVLPYWQNKFAAAILLTLWGRPSLFVVCLWCAEADDTTRSSVPLQMPGN